MIVCWHRLLQTSETFQSSPLASLGPHCRGRPTPLAEEAQTGSSARDALAREQQHGHLRIASLAPSMRSITEPGIATVTTKVQRPTMTLVTLANIISYSRLVKHTASSRVEVSALVSLVRYPRWLYTLVSSPTKSPSPLFRRLSRVVENGA